MAGKFNLETLKYLRGNIIEDLIEMRIPSEFNPPLKNATKRMDDEGAKKKETIFYKVTSNLIKFSRYMVKYITSYEKVFKYATKKVK